MKMRPTLSLKGLFAATTVAAFLIPVFAFPGASFVYLPALAILLLAAAFFSEIRRFRLRDTKFKFGTEWRLTTISLGLLVSSIVFASLFDIACGKYRDASVTSQRRWTGRCAGTFGGVGVCGWRMVHVELGGSAFFCALRRFFAGAGPRDVRGGRKIGLARAGTVQDAMLRVQMYAWQPPSSPFSRSTSSSSLRTIRCRSNSGWRPSGCGIAVRRPWAGTWWAAPKAMSARSAAIRADTAIARCARPSPAKSGWPPGKNGCWIARITTSCSRCRTN
jgi:hypothetical protein